MFNKKLKEYKEKQTEIREEMERYNQADEKFYLTTNIVLKLAQKAEQIFESSEIPEKRQLLNSLLQNLKLEGKKLNFELKTPLTRRFRRTSVLICSGFRPPSNFYNNFTEFNSSN